MTDPFVQLPVPERRYSHKQWVVTTDPVAFDVDVATAFLRDHSYWAPERTRAVEAVAAANSRCYSLLDGAGQMVGGCRAVTDFATFAWIADVFVLPPARREGLGKFLIECVTDDLAHVDRLFLGTRDAHGLYAQFGFVPTKRNERWMERLLPEAVSPSQ